MLLHRVPGVLVLLVLWLPAGVLAQEAGAPAPVDREQVEAVIAALEDPASREALVERLRVLAQGMEEAPAEPGRMRTATSDLMRGVSERIGALAGGAGAVAAGVAEVPALWADARAAAVDPAWLERLGVALLRLLGILAAAYLAWGLAHLITRRPRRAARGYRGHSVLGRSLWLLANFVLELLPVAAFAAVGYLVLAAVETGEVVRIVALAWINASVLLRVVLAATRVITAPAAPRLRLLAADDAAAAAVDRWVRRLLAIGIYGYFALQAALLLGLRPRLYDVLADVLGLLVVLLLAAALVANRAAISRLIRGSEAPADDRAGGRAVAVAALRQSLARVWPLVAGLYLVVLFGVWALEVRGGALYILRATVLSLVVLVLTHALQTAVGRALPRWLERSAAASPAPAGLGGRLRRFAPPMQTAIRWLLYAVAGVVLLQAWGVDTFGWLASDAGRTLAGALLRILGILLAAGLVWEVSAFLLERWLADTDAAGRPQARTARTRTLLTVARNALLVVITIVSTLMVLSELGVDIAPLLAGAGVLGLAVGFGAQRLVQDVITGVFILLQDLMSVGDVVKLGDRAGLVEAISIRTVRLRDLSGTVHTIPFSAIDTVSNLTKDFSFHVFDLGVAYREDVDEVMALIHEVGAELRQDEEVGPLILEDLEIFGVDAFGDSAVVIKGRIKTRPIKQWQVGRAFNRRIKLRFDAAGIEIPFPHRTLYFGEDKTGRAPAMRLEADASQELVRQLRPGDAAPEGT